MAASTWPVGSYTLRCTRTVPQGGSNSFAAPNIPVPSGVPAWKYQLTPTAGQYTAQFAYDSVGRCTDVYKLQSTTTNPWSYVQTHTTYGGNSDGSWGQANSVTEDDGGINRLTQTKAYTAWGKACDVIDGAGHEFATSYDLDGNVLSVTRTDVTPNQTIASYTYGNLGVSNGQVTSVTDGLSGVEDTITYQPTGGGLGQVSAVAETGPNLNYTVSYTYNSAGDRWQTTYSTPNGTGTWEYDDYETLGPIFQPHRVFQTLTLLQNGVLSPEQMNYEYDSSGALVEAAFAQTPTSGFTPSTGQSWYQSGEPASSRCLAWYTYDPAGRVLTVEHDWETWGSGGYTPQAVLQNDCTYEYSGLNRGVKLTSQNIGPQGSETDTYSYDPNFDYLTGTTYTDNVSPSSESWTYDAAGNRTDSVVDNLNRTTSIGGVATTCDILGNRLTFGSNTSYGWDCLNRMTSYSGTSGSASYSYRADGMRVAKSATIGGTATATTYAYDGQMGFEDTDVTGGSTTVTDYGLGARGIDWINKAGNISFPCYDAHGNMVATIARSGSGYTLSNQRSYDAWGWVREQSGPGDPKGRYCAKLGHKQDDESGLIYMRARFYDPVSGRFGSEDTQRSGGNWFAYAADNPVCTVDPSGTDNEGEQFAACFLIAWALSAAFSSAYRYVAPLVMLSSFAVYCYSQIAEAGGVSPALGAITGVLTTVGVGGAFLANGQYLAKLFGGVGSALANSVGMAGNSQYYGLLGATLCEIAVYSICCCCELLLDDYLSS